MNWDFCGELCAVHLRKVVSRSTSRLVTPHVTNWIQTQLVTCPKINLKWVKVVRMRWKMLKISAFYLDKQKSFVPKKNMPHFFLEQNYFVCQDRKLKFLASFWFRISWNLTKFQLSIFTNKKVFILKKSEGMLQYIYVKSRYYYKKSWRMEDGGVDRIVINCRQNQLGQNGRLFPPFLIFDL